ncbi:unnamed protein product [Oppiella nova]|uniref:Uncharacterized protein n=1 Tax=Oppiella nova TaxID=334625 RepID=A0A7R9LXF8_9ACAR|nr:unnamed protein product [Oppiella nova]CAG2167258.1 unnamed protein product [Oppiella nova]
MNTHFETIVQYCKGWTIATVALFSDAILKNPGYLKLRKIRAAQQVAKTIATSQNRVYLNASSLMLNIADKDFDVTNEAIQKGRK